MTRAVHTLALRTVLCLCCWSGNIKGTCYIASLGIISFFFFKLHSKLTLISEICNNRVAEWASAAVPLYVCKEVTHVLPLPTPHSGQFLPISQLSLDMWQVPNRRIKATMLHPRVCPVNSMVPDCVTGQHNTLGRMSYLHSSTYMGSHATWSARGEWVPPTVTAKPDLLSRVDFLIWILVNAWRIRSGILVWSCNSTQQEFWPTGDTLFGLGEE